MSTSPAGHIQAALLDAFAGSHGKFHRDRLMAALAQINRRLVYEVGGSSPAGVAMSIACLLSAYGHRDEVTYNHLQHHAVRPDLLRPIRELWGLPFMGPPLTPTCEERLRTLVANLSEAHKVALIAILEEGARARAKRGPQPHPWGRDRRLMKWAAALEVEARISLDGRPTWSAILAEEAGEALCELDPANVRGEVVQTGAMCLAALAECPDLEVPRG